MRTSAFSFLCLALCAMCLANGDNDFESMDKFRKNGRKKLVNFGAKKWKNPKKMLEKLNKPSSIPTLDGVWKLENVDGYSSVPENGKFISQSTDSGPLFEQNLFSISHSILEQFLGLITNLSDNMDEELPSETYNSQSNDLKFFGLSSSLPKLNLLNSQESISRNKRDILDVLDQGRTLAQLIPLLNNNNILSGISFVISNGATFLFLIFIAINILPLAFGRGRSSEISPLEQLALVEDPKTLKFLLDIPKYLEYADLGRLVDYGFSYLDIQDRQCQMRSVCEAQQFIMGRSETVAMIVKSLSSFSTIMGDDMVRAIDNALDHRSCSTEYADCRSSLLDLILGKATRMIRERIGK